MTCVSKEDEIPEAAPLDTSAMRLDWDLPELVVTNKKWKELTIAGKFKRVFDSLAKFVGVLCCLYFFICSLDFMSSAFRLLGAKTAGKAFAESNFLNNPITALMLGVMVAALLHSSSMVVSVIIAMVASRIIKVRQAIPIIMGADIGTAITNIIVSIIGGKGSSGTGAGKRDQFKRAFAAATVHDMFNWLSVVIFLPLEIMTGFLYHLSLYVVSKLNIEQANYKQKQMLKRLTKPFTNFFIQLDEKALEDISKNVPGSLNLKILKSHCPTAVSNNISILTGIVKNTTFNASDGCKFVFAKFHLSDNWTGIVMLIVSLGMLAACLIGMVKILQSLLKTRVCLSVRRVINYRLPGKFGFLTGYFAILFGAFVTFMIQSSTIFTSTLTPLVGIGLVALENVYPLTLGSNIGTTTTGLLASLTVSGTDILATDLYNSTNSSTTYAHNSLKASLQIALIHTFYNSLGVLLFYPLPFMRWPLFVAKFLGEVCFKYRWFSLAYLAIFYFFFPAIIFSLSALGGFKLLLFAFVIPMLSTLLFVIVVNKVREKNAKMLPPILRSWDFLPECLRSLQPIDRIITRCMDLFKPSKPLSASSNKTSGVVGKRNRRLHFGGLNCFKSRKLRPNQQVTNSQATNNGDSLVLLNNKYSKQTVNNNNNNNNNGSSELTLVGLQQSLTELDFEDYRRLRQSPSLKFNPKASITDSGIVAETDMLESSTKDAEQNE